MALSSKDISANENEVAIVHQILLHDLDEGSYHEQGQIDEACSHSCISCKRTRRSNSVQISKHYVIFPHISRKVYSDDESERSNECDGDVQDTAALLH